MRFNDELLPSSAAEDPGNDDGGLEEPRRNGERDLEELLIDPLEDCLMIVFCDRFCLRTESI